ncbi:MAG TPA: hypothetical protein VFR33_01460 [Candidatus Dormibacteraeota bacterium]|nr:hypothetical protein [Candidatus Dormibacteraeota bacterium]
MAIVLIAACGGTTGPSGSRTASIERSTPSSTPGTSPSLPAGADLGFLRPGSPVSAASAARTSELACNGAIGAADSVAIVQLHTGGTVLRDYADVAHPRTVCTFGPDIPGGVTLLDARHILTQPDFGYLYAVVEVPAVHVRYFQLPQDSNHFPLLIAVSPRFDQVAYLVDDLTDNTDKVHIASAAGDVIVASLPNPHGGRCGSPEDSRLGEFTRSAQSLFVLDQPFPTLNSLVVLQGGKQALLATPPGLTISSDGSISGGWPQGTQPAMALWAPTSETLYYRQGGDVWKWTASTGAQRFLPGVSWYYPTISADGAHLAYAALRPDGLHNVYLVDLVHGGSPQLIGKGARNLPVFLNSTQLWYRSEGQGICGPSGDQPLVYDLTDGSEASSIVDFVGSVWPSTSSNF